MNSIQPRAPRVRTSRADIARLQADAAPITRRLLETAATLPDVAREYRVGRLHVERIYHAATTPAQRLAAARRKHREGSPAHRVTLDAKSITRRLLETDATVNDIAVEYGCGNSVVCAVYSANATFRQREAARLRKMRPHASKNFIRPGSTPWNKGKKGIHLSPATEFKKGCLRGQAARRWTVVGAVTVRTDKGGQKYRFIKARHDGPPQHRWRPFAHHVWEKAHGPVPKGHRVVHLDLDSMNDELANLACLSGGEAIQWQRRVLPKMEERRQRENRKAQAKRWAIARSLKDHRREHERLQVAKKPERSRVQRLLEELGVA